mmetsp:Transcript_760/g.2459  ORF Transcript_760/g.2459 Transcript_760/m.2459 type:complete len:240 (-) Transcript_760:936-1655(-)
MELLENFVSYNLIGILQEAQEYCIQCIDRLDGRKKLRKLVETCCDVPSRIRVRAARKDPHDLYHVGQKLFPEAQCTSGEVVGNFPLHRVVVAGAEGQHCHVYTSRHVPHPVLVRADHQPPKCFREDLHQGHFRGVQPVDVLVCSRTRHNAVIVKQGRQQPRVEACIRVRLSVVFCYLGHGAEGSSLDAGVPVLDKLSQLSPDPRLRHLQRYLQTSLLQRLGDHATDVYVRVVTQLQRPI